VKIATREYATEQDVVGRFVAECCEVGAGFEQQATELYEAFRAAFPDSDMTQTAFGRELAERGYIGGRLTSGPHKNRKTWKGLRLASSGGEPKPKPVKPAKPNSKPSAHTTEREAIAEALWLWRAEGNG
jgi:phage/plasmid-associated DNA primase